LDQLSGLAGAHLSATGGGGPNHCAASRATIRAFQSSGTAPTYVVPDTRYADFAPEVGDRRALAEIIGSDPSIAEAHRTFLDTLDAWWNDDVGEIESLAPANGGDGNVYALRRSLLASIEQAFADNNLLTGHQIRGAFARWVDDLKADLKSVAASGWGPELIPDADIPESQFPEVLAETEANRARLAELAALFAAADEEDFDDVDETGVLPADDVKAIKDEIKEARARHKACFKELKTLVNDLFAELKSAGLIPKGTRKGDLTVKGTQGSPDYGSAEGILLLAASTGWTSERTEAIADRMRVGPEAFRRARQLTERLARHKALEDEARRLKAELRTTEKKQDELVAAARQKIDRDEAQRVILERLHRLLRSCNLIQPPYFPMFSVERFEGRNLIVLWAPGGQNRPYKAPKAVTVRRKEYRYYIRRYSSTIEAKGQDERELISLTATVPFDDRFNQTAKVEDLSFRLMEEFLRAVGSDLAGEVRESSTEALGRQMNVMGGPPEAPLPKNVGLLFFNEAPHRFFPATQIDVVYFPEDAGGDRFEEKVFQGPVDRIAVTPFRSSRGTMSKRRLSSIPTGPKPNVFGTSHWRP